MALTLLNRIKQKAIDTANAVGSTLANVGSNLVKSGLVGFGPPPSPINIDPNTIKDFNFSPPPVPQTGNNLVDTVSQIAQTPSRMTSWGLNTIKDLTVDPIIENIINPIRPENLPNTVQNIQNNNPFASGLNPGDRVKTAWDNPLTQATLAIPFIGGTTKNVGKMTLEKAPSFIDDAVRAGKIGLEEANLLRQEYAPVIKKAKPIVDEALKTGNLFRNKSTARKTVESLFGDTSVAGTKGIIKKAGKAGEEIVKLLDQADQEASHLSGKAVVKLQDTFKGLNEQELSTFSDVVEGLSKPISKVQAKAVKVWNGMAEEVRAAAKAAGIDMGTIDKYFPHYTKELNKADKIVLAQELVSKGKFKTEAEALQAIEQEASSLGRNAQRRFANLELSRKSDLNLPYNKSPNVLFDYLQNAYGRVADAKNFGLNDEKLYKLARASGTQGGDSGQVLQYLDQILGKNQTGSKVGEKLMSFQTITKLNPITSVKNLTQNLSTWLRTDTGTMARTMKSIVSNPEQAFKNATLVGEIDPNMAKQLADYAGEGKGASKWIRLIGMQGTERFNRVVAVNAGMDYVGKLVKQAVGGSTEALRELERFGVTAKDFASGKLPEDILLEAGRKLSKMTQFSTKAGDLPYGWKTNAGKVLTQFKSFGYKQTGFIKNEGARIYTEAKNGNFKPLLNALTVYGISAPIAGEILNDVESVFRNKERKTAFLSPKRYLENILGATSFGLFDNVSGLLGQYGEGGVVGTVGGPTASDAYKVASGIGDLSSAAQGNETDLKPLARNIIKEIPAVGPTIANSVVPNSYVDNYALGVNNGLDKNNNETYKNLLKTDTVAAEKFKAGNQQSDKPKSTLSLFGKKEAFDWKVKPTSKKAKSEYDKQVDTALENGAELPDEALVNRFFDGKTYKDAKSNADKEKVMQSLLKAVDDEYLTPEQKAKISNAAGVDQTTLDYYRLASTDEEDKIAQMVDFASTTELDHDKFMIALALNKRRVAGRSISTTGMLDRLYDEGFINKQDKAFLTALKFDSVYNKFYMDRDYKGGGMTDAQRKATVTKINSIFKVQNQKTPELKTLDINNGKTELKNPLKESSKLNLRIANKKSASRWFNA